MSEERENQKESDHDSSSLRIHSSNISEQPVSSELKGKKPRTRRRPCTPPQLHVEPKAVVENRNKATSMQMEKEWRDSPLCFNDTKIVISMRRTAIQKNVYEQYNWYLDQVFKKHSEYFSARIVEINNRKPVKKGVISLLSLLPSVCETPQDVMYFQEQNKHKLTGRRGGVYMGFSKDKVKEYFGLSLESLLIFTESSRCYVNNMTTYTSVSPKCLIAQLKTRMLFSDNVQHLTLINFHLASVLSEAVEVISKLTTTTSDTLKDFTSNTKEWRKSEEYRLDSEMVENSKQAGLFKCIDLYFQWYTKLVSEKHRKKFTQRIAKINKASSKVPNSYTISVVDNNVALALLGFQLHYKDALDNGEVCMGFSKREVDEQYGITVESLFTLNTCAEQSLKSGVTICGQRSDCIVSDLITRMKNAKYRTYQCEFNQSMVQILYKTLEVVSEITTLPSKFDVKLHLEMLREAEEDEHDTDKKQEENMNPFFLHLLNAQQKVNKAEEEWQKTEEYRLDSEMVENSKQAGLFKCIDLYFQWYTKLVSEKHRKKFTQRIAKINKASSKVPNSYTISVVDNNVALALLGFQLHYKDALDNGEVCMGFSKREVDEQYGITVESLFTLNTCAEQSLKSGVTICGQRSDCIVSDLITRMKNAEYRTYQSKFNRNMVRILYKTLEVVSEITTPSNKFYVKLQEALRTFAEKRNKAKSMQMEKEWRDSPLCFNDTKIVISMRRTAIQKNVYEQYNWYLDQVFKKHSEYFSARIVEINNRKPVKKGVISLLSLLPSVCETPQDVMYFQEQNKHKLTGRRGGVYMGFSKDKVKEYFGLSLESLLIFTESSRCYVNNMTTYTSVSPKCLIAQLKTRMLFSDNVQHLTLINFHLASVLSEAFEVISKLATTTSDTP